MTVSSTTRKAGPFAGNNLATTFPFNFKIFAKGDIKALLVSPNGLSTQLTLDSDYSVQLNANQDQLPGGWVTYPISGAPLAVNYELVLLGDLPYDQETDLTNSGGFYPQTVEDMVDRSTIQIQQLAEIASRAIVINEAESVSPVLPDASGRANTVVGFDALGNLKVYALTPAIGAGDLKDERFVDGVDYTSGVSNYITVSRSYGNKANLGAVVMQGVVQDPNSYAYDTSTNRVTFDAVIPAGIGVIWLKGGTTLSNYVPPDGSVGDDQLQWGAVLPRVVASVFALQNLNVLKYQRASTNAYYVGGKGAGDYYYDPTYLAANANGGTAIASLTGPGCWRLIPNLQITAHHFGAKGDGVTDDTAAINAALASGLTGELVFLPGTYMTAGNHAIPAGVYIAGSGQLATTISSTSLANDVFLMASSDSGVRGLTITGLTTRTAGRFIATTGGQGGPNIIRDVTYTNYFIGIQINSARTFVDNITAINACSTNSQVIGVVNASDVFIKNVSADTSIKPAYGLLVTKASGLWVSDCDFIHCTNGVALTPSGSDQIIDCFFNNVAADSCGNNCWTLATSGTAIINSCAFENCWGASAVNYGFVTQGVGGAIDTLYFSNWNCVNNGLEGTYFQSNTKNVTMVGGIVSGNSQSSGVANGIRIGPNLGGFSITGMRVGPTQNFADTQFNQIVVEAGTGNNINISSCDLSTPSKTPITFSANGQTNSVTNCGGVVSKGQVAATTDVAGHIAVAHNLGAAPNEVFISVTNSATPIFAQADSFTATGFRVTFWSAGGSLMTNTAVAFSWRIGF